jgi:hypothetical protein
VFKNKLILFLAFFCYIDIFYKCSWLPGSKILLDKAFYLNEAATIIFIILSFDFSILHSRIVLFYKENKYFTILFILLFISSVFFNRSEFSSIYYISYYLAYLFNFFIYFFLLPKFIISNKEYLHKLLYFISIFSLFFSILGLLLTFAGLAPEERFVGLVTSVFIHPNFVPSVCLAGLFSTLTLFHTTNKDIKLIRIFLLISFTIQFLALTFSFTRDGMIAFVSGISIFYFLAYRKKFIYALPFVLTVVPFLIYGFIKLKGFVSFLSRFLLLIPAYYMFISDTTRMIWGYGVSNSTEVYVRYKILYSVLENVDSPHNSYISYIFMYGLIFTFVFLWVIFLTLKKGIKFAYKEKNDNVRIYLSSFISIIVAYLIINLFESHLAMAHLTMMQPFMIFFGLLFFSLRDNEFYNSFRITDK